MKLIEEVKLSTEEYEVIYSGIMIPNYKNNIMVEIDNMLKFKIIFMEDEGELRFEHIKQDNSLIVYNNHLKGSVFKEPFQIGMLGIRQKNMKFNYQKIYFNFQIDKNYEKFIYNIYTKKGEQPISIEQTKEEKHREIERLKKELIEKIDDYMGEK